MLSENYEKMSLRKSLLYTGISRRMWYHKPEAREIGLDLATVSGAKDRRQETYLQHAPHGSPNVPQDTYCYKSQEDTENIPETRLIEPQKTKNHTIRTNRKIFKPDAPNLLLETDMTYVWRGMDGWCYCFNVADCFTRRWISHAFDVDATKQVTIDSITNAVSVKNPDCSELRLRTDNGTQYTSNGFRKAVSVFGIKHEFIWKHTPE